MKSVYILAASRSHHNDGVYSVIQSYSLLNCQTPHTHSYCSLEPPQPDTNLNCMLDTPSCNFYPKVSNTTSHIYIQALSDS